MAEISVVVPTKDSASTLGMCLMSLHAQTARPEIIVVDNFSKDETLQIAHQLADVVLCAGPERSSQRNLGARAARGGALLFIDSDMQLEPEVISQCLAVLGSGTTQLIVPEHSFGHGYWAAVRKFERDAYIGEPGFEAARCFSTDLFRRTGGYDEGISAGEDFELHFRALAAGGAIARIDAAIWHNEGTPTLRSLVQKQRQYGSSLEDAGELIGSLGVRRPSLARLGIRRWRYLARQPKLLAGLALLKALEYWHAGRKSRKGMRSAGAR